MVLADVINQKTNAVAADLLRLVQPGLIDLWRHADDVSDFVSVVLQANNGEVAITGGPRESVIAHTPWIQGLPAGALEALPEYFDVFVLLNDGSIAQYRVPFSIWRPIVLAHARQKDN